mgnify:CR=1 FL=1|jgi:hypothetical protein|nr:MAG TPA: hypothetical protein [Caudoviricetes sp.]
MSKKGGSKTVKIKRELTPEEKALYAQQIDYLNKVSPVISNLLAKGNASLGNIYEPDWKTLISNYNKEYNNILGQQSDLLQGKLPTAWQNAKNMYYNRTYENTLGSQLQNLASKGVLSSSRMNTATNDMQKNLSAQMSKNYTDDISSLNNMLNTRMSWLKNPMNNALTAHNSTYGEATGLLGTAASLQGGNTNALQTISNNENQSTAYMQQQNSNPWGDFFGAALSVGSKFIK